MRDTNFPGKGLRYLRRTSFEQDKVDMLSKREHAASKEKKHATSSGEKAASPQPVSMLQLFRFARGRDWFLVSVGILAGWVSGLCMPIMTVLFGNLSDVLVQFGSQWNDACSNFSGAVADSRVIEASEFSEQIAYFSVGITLVGCVQLVLCYLMVAALNSAAESQVHRIRSLFFKSVLRQDMAWYDTNPSGEFASRSSDDLAKLQDGIGEKIGMFNLFLSTFLFSVLNAFVHGWQLTLVMLSLVPLIGIGIAILAKVETSVAEAEQKAYAVAGTVAEEALTAIRTVVAFGGEAKEVKRYEHHLVSATKTAIKRGLLTAIGASSFWFTIFASIAIAFWYGVHLILEAKNEPDPSYYTSNLIIVFFSVLLGALNMSQSAPYIEAFSQARAAAASIFEIIDREPSIDSSSSDGIRPKEMIGNIQFTNVYFNYPSRPNVEVLQGLDLCVKKGETVALVGESGCGKSTAIQLLQRLYDPQSGTITIDGHNLRSLNVGWLRDHIGIVGQEPVLFGTTIAENIRYGQEDATQEDIERAARAANAHHFIFKLPKKYDTLVGDRGTQLSGGQKQRLAIARAIIKNPKILLLDEATSALDSESEAVVQTALEKASQGRTTIIIAHRLSTIRHANKIAAFSEGKVVEIGSHEQLMAFNGIYRALVLNTQQPHSPDDVSETEFPEVEEAYNGLYQRSVSFLSDDSVDRWELQQPVLLRQPRILKKNHDQYEYAHLEEEDTKLQPSLLKVLKLNRPEWVYVVLGCAGAAGLGFSMPAFSVVFGDIMGTLSNCNVDETSAQSVLYSCMFLVIGTLSSICSFVQVSMLTRAGELLTKRLRKLSFASMLKQEIGWFDSPANSVGILSTRLAVDASCVQAATGSRVGTILQAICTLAASIITAMILLWKMALVNIGFIPLIIFSSYLQKIIVRGQALSEFASLDKANKIAIETISNIRTVAALHRENKFHETYMQQLERPHKSAMKSAHLRGLVYGFAQSIPYFAYASCMAYGGYLILNEGADYATVFKVAELYIMSTTMVGQSFAFAPNYNRGMLAAARIFKLLERNPRIVSPSENIKLKKESSGKLEFKDVAFQYPTRPEFPVLRGLNLTIRQGEVTALVGSSGCGKSTCLQLLERFYDATGGELTMDGTNIAQLSLPWLRSQMGIVSQEPILFDRSIAENIAYGDPTRSVPMEEIVQAAMDANIHHFICSLPLGYDTSAGEKGAQLSGGQKQRIAIARALIRNPKLLLLDEATSALDMESEKIVQEALSRAQVGRTCIVVAHRLSTIKNADQIVVIHRGRVVEIGTHNELLAQKGYYYRFYHTVQTNRNIS